MDKTQAWLKLSANDLKLSTNDKDVSRKEACEILLAKENKEWLVEKLNMELNPNTLRSWFIKQNPEKALNVMSAIIELDNKKKTNNIEEPTNNIEELANNIEEPTNNIEEPTNNIEEPTNNIEELTNNSEEPTNNIEELYNATIKREQFDYEKIIMPYQEKIREALQSDLNKNADVAPWLRYALEHDAKFAEISLKLLDYWRAKNEAHKNAFKENIDIFKKNIENKKINSKGANQYEEHYKSYPSNNTKRKRQFSLGAWLWIGNWFKIIKKESRNLFKVQSNTSSASVKIDPPGEKEQESNLTKNQQEVEASQDENKKDNVQVTSIGNLPPPVSTTFTAEEQKITETPLKLELPPPIPELPATDQQHSNSENPISSTPPAANLQTPPASNSSISIAQTPRSEPSLPDTPKSTLEEESPRIREIFTPPSKEENTQKEPKAKKRLDTIFSSLNSGENQQTQPGNADTEIPKELTFQK